MMRVVDEKKWRRAKIIFTWIVAISFVGAIGGLEGTEPMPSPALAFYLFPLLTYMIWNITKNYR